MSFKLAFGCTIFVLSLLLSSSSNGQSTGFVGFPGDFDFDGRVDLDDAFTLISNLGSSGVYCDGDFNQNGTVDMNDLYGFSAFGVFGTSNVRPGDASRDGTIDILSDAFLILGNFGTSTDPLQPIVDGWEQGDINSDGAVDNADLQLLFEIIADPPTCPIDIATLLARQEAVLQAAFGSYNSPPDVPLDDLRFNSSSFWGLGLGVDFSGIGNVGSREVTMVSSRVGLTASHHGLSQGNVISFGRYTPSGNVIAARTIEKNHDIRDDQGNKTDLRVVIFENAVPAAVTRYKTIDYLENYDPPCRRDYTVLVTNSNLGKTLSIRDGEAPFIAAFGAVPLSFSANPDYPYVPSTGGDSSNPSFLIYEKDNGNRELAIVATHHTKYSGPFIPFYRNKINAFLQSEGLSDRLLALPVKYDSTPPAPLPPVAGDDVYDYDPSSTVFGVSQNDSDPNCQGLTLVSAGGETSPTLGNYYVLQTVAGGTVYFGSFTAAGNNNFYQPPAGFSGADSFTYTITNGTGEATATVTINVP